MASDISQQEETAPSHGPRIVNWLFTAFNGLLFIPACVFAMMALYNSAPDDQDTGLALYMNVALAILPITIIIAMTTAWIYHRGGWHKTSYGCHLAPLANVALVVLLRLAH